MKSMKFIYAILISIAVLTLNGCETRKMGAAAKESIAVNRQQAQFAKGQPVPAINWSLERDLLIKLYAVRNSKVATHSVWRSDRGLVEGDCPSLGYGLPYDTSLTNPSKVTSIDPNRARMGYHGYVDGLATIDQAEPNGIFPSKNTAATWVMCTGAAGSIEPVYVETKVTVYPYSVSVDYNTNRVTKRGKATVNIKPTR